MAGWCSRRELTRANFSITASWGCACGSGVTEAGLPSQEPCQFREHGMSGKPPDRGMRRSTAGALEALLDILPVDRVPPGRQVVGAPVLVLQVVGVLPDVDAQERRRAIHQRAVLIGLADDVELAVLGDQPAPAGAEQVGGRVGELFLERPEVAERLEDGVAERAGGRAAAVRAHDLP